MAGRCDKAASIPGRLLIWLLFFSHICASPASAADKPSDEAIRNALIGSWIVPRGSSDYDGTPSREVFRSDGTYVYYLYRDRTCRQISREIVVKWNVKNGVLTSIIPDGRVTRDEVMKIDSRRMTLHSLDDGAAFTREKSESCIDSGA